MNRSVKEHYDKHLELYYSWMIGDFEERKSEFLEFCQKQRIFPRLSGSAIDLGSGHGIQSVALAELGFNVTAIDFNRTLLDELDSKKGELSIEILEDDLRNLTDYKEKNPELVVCLGDTLSHLDTEDEISKIIKDMKTVLTENGQVMLSFRDYSTELLDTNRFIPVKSDSGRIMTVFLEYFDDTVKVTDLVYELSGNRWIQKVSSYVKVRTTENMIRNIMESNGLKISYNDRTNGLVTLIGENPEM